MASDPGFLFSRERNRLINDRTRGSWIAVFTSTWHGISRDNKIQLEVRSKQRPWQSCNNVCAIRGPSINQEWTLWEVMDFVENIPVSLANAFLFRQVPRSLNGAPHEGFIRQKDRRS